MSFPVTIFFFRIFIGLPSSNGLRLYAKLAHFAYLMLLNKINNVTKENSKVILGRYKN